MPIEFKKAERRKAKAKIAICAPAGGGKTHSALLIAGGLGGKVAVIDTENGSASLEAGKEGVPEFFTVEMHAPFTPEKYIQAMKDAEAAGFDIIVIDSLSHAWAGVGGLLDQVDAKAKASKSGNSFTAWRDVTPSHNKLVDAIIQSGCHVLATMRTKTEYAMQEDEKGRKVPKKIGMAPIQREGMDYEFTIVLDMDQASHYATATKDRTSLFDGNPFKPTVETGKLVSAWLNAAAEPLPAEPEAPEAPEAPKATATKAKAAKTKEKEKAPEAEKPEAPKGEMVSRAQVDAIENSWVKLCEFSNIQEPAKSLAQTLGKRYNVRNSSDLTSVQADEVLSLIAKKMRELAPDEPEKEEPEVDPLDAAIEGAFPGAKVEEEPLKK